MEEQRKSASILSLGTSPDRSQKALWKSVEKKVFEKNPHYIPHPIVGREGEDSEFFILHIGPEAIGRAAATINWQLIEERREKVGFIDDFVISPEHEHLADMLIDRCLSVLKEKGIEEAGTRYQGFPALAAQELTDTSPFTLPCNPPNYIPIFERKGFTKDKEWANFRFKLPPEIPEANIKRGTRVFESMKAELKPINTRSRSQIKEYNELLDHVLVNLYGYTPPRFLTEADSLAKILLFSILAKLAKFKIYVGLDKAGKVFGFFSFCPNYNIALKPLVKPEGRFKLLKVLKVPFYLRTTKRAELVSIGIAEEMRRKGFVRIMDYAFQAMKKEGYTEFDTGPMLVENQVVIKMALHMQKKYGLQMEHMKYHSLRYPL